MDVEKETWAQFRKEIDAKGRPGVTILLCPNCRKVVRSFDSTINALNKWAFDENGESCIYDGRGCCF